MEESRKRPVKSALLCLPFVGVLSACASLPASSVKLSDEVGRGIDAQYETQVKLVDLYFEEKRHDLDEDMIAALNSYFEKIAPNGTVSLTRDELNDVVIDVETLNRKNNASKQALDKERVALISKLNRVNRALARANAAITGLLRSSVSLRNAQSEALADIDDATGGAVDVESVVRKVNRIAEEGGPGTAKAKTFVEALENLRGESKSKERTSQ